MNNIINYNLLCDDVFYIIFQYIDFKTYINLLYTCKKFNKILKLLDFYEEITEYKKVCYGDRKLETHRDKRNNSKNGKTFSYSIIISECFLINDKLEGLHKYFLDNGSYIIDEYHNNEICGIMYEFDYYEKHYIEEKYLFDGDHIRRRTFDLNCNIVCEEYTINKNQIEFNSKIDYIIEGTNKIKKLTVCDYVKNYKYEIRFNNGIFRMEYEQIKDEKYYKIIEGYYDFIEELLLERKYDK